MPLSLIFIQPGTYTIDDNGIPGDNISVIRDSNGVVIFTFAHPADALTFTVSTPGVNIIVNFTDSMNAANFTIGSTNPDPMVGPPQSPDSIVMQNIETSGTVTLVANTTITEGNDADLAADITAGALVMSAVSGIGTPANALETRTGLFEAETTTGGVNISNFGSVQIGGVSADVDGLDVATSGDINFITRGSIFLTEANSVTAGEVVHGGSTSGNVTLTALGANSDIIGNVNNGAVTVPRGSLLMTAGRDIQLGTIGTDFNNDVVTSGSLTFLAGRDILIDGFADILSDNFGLDTGGNLVFTAGRNIGILNVAGVSASVAASGSGGADLLFTTGFNGTLTVNGPGSFAVGSTSGDVTVVADRLLIDAGSGISAPTGNITILTATDGRPVILGSAGDAAFAMELSDAEIDRIFATTLTIGDDTTGPITVIAPITVTAAGSPEAVTLRSGTAINLNSSFTTLGSLVLRSVDNVFQTAASTITTNDLTVFIDAPDDDPGTGGTATFSGTFVVTTNVINGNADGDILNGNAAANTLFGFAGNDTLRGFAGADILDGGVGADSMNGGLGNDTLRVDNLGDTIGEAVGEGNDLVVVSASYVLNAGAEIETIGTINAAATTPINITGNEFAQSIFGNAGINFLNGGAGNDSLNGLGGNDTYIIDSGDVVVEAVGQGDDVVIANFNYVLTVGAEVETITNTTGANLALTGNEFGQSIFGNAGVNVLQGLGGNDQLLGFGDNDVLVGGTGADVMRGGTGNDSYNVDNVGDQVFENVGEGDDSLFTSVSYTLNLGAQVENLGTTNPSGTDPISLGGNEFGQSLFGNAGNNVLTGGGGADNLTGFGGNDSYNVDNAGDQVFEGAGEGDDAVFASASYALNGGAQVETLGTTNGSGTGAINLTGNDFAQSIFGNNGANVLNGDGGNDSINGADGNDILNGGSGNDVLNGGAGGDEYRFTTNLNAFNNVDTIVGYTPFADGIALDDAVFTSLSPGSLPAGAFRTGTSALDADDRIIYDPATGNLFYDADGNGAGAQIQFATLQGAPVISNNDFIVI